MVQPLFLTLLYVAFSFAAILPKHDDHDHSVKRALPKRWYHARDHPAHALFRRADDDGHEYPEVGSPTWTAAYPSFSPDAKDNPQAWTDTLNAAVAAGKIPNTPRSSNTPGTNPVYPHGVNPQSDEVCSSTYKCPTDDAIWDAPDGHFALSFDDGPQPSSNRLYDFLAENQETTTLFMIGVHILQNPRIFVRAFEEEHDIAAHTYTHPYMTTLSNEDILAQLGWNMQIIHDSTGGRLPRYWRPPYGDSDTRVRAIAREVFGLETVIWNHDTADWSLTTGGTTLPAINRSMTEWLEGPKSPGLMVLEHDRADLTVDAFIAAYPVVKQNGWQTISMAQMEDPNGAYQNANGPKGDVIYTEVGTGGASGSPPEGEDDPAESAGSGESSTGSSSSPTGSVSRPGPGQSQTSSGSQAQSSAVTDNAAIGLSHPAWKWTASLLALTTLLL